MTTAALRPFSREGPARVLDDVQGHVEPARAAGRHAVSHLEAAESIRRLEEVIAAQL